MSFMLKVTSKNLVSESCIYVINIGFKGWIYTRQIDPIPTLYIADMLRAKSVS